VLLFRKALGKRKEKLEKKGEKNPTGISQDKLENSGIFSQA
jgi:hypothetical protein